MERRKFSREFKIEAAKLVSERGVSVAQASRDLDVHQTVLRKWVKELSGSPQEAFPGHGQMKPEQQGDCQDFRVWPGIMGNKESHYVTTQRTCHTE